MQIKLACWTGEGAQRLACEIHWLLQDSYKTQPRLLQQLSGTVTWWSECAQEEHHTGQELGARTGIWNNNISKLSANLNQQHQNKIGRLLFPKKFFSEVYTVEYRFEYSFQAAITRAVRNSSESMKKEQKENRKWKILKIANRFLP